MTRTLRVAALQLDSANGDVTGNLARARVHVAEAAAAGAQLVLLPELFAAGYSYDRSVAWAAAEPLPGGPTSAWLAEESRKHGIHLAATLLEATPAGHFHNTFVLYDSRGKLLCAVRKRPPAAAEAFLFQAGDAEQAGRVAFCPDLCGGTRVCVGICWECQLAPLARHAASKGAQLLLMPHCAPKVVGMPPSVSRGFARAVAALPNKYAAAFGVPVVFCNKSGPFVSPFLDAPLLRWYRLDTQFLGGTVIVAAGGNTVAGPSYERNALIIGDVEVGPPASAISPPVRRGLLSFARSSLVDDERLFTPLTSLPAVLRILFAVVGLVGTCVYRIDVRRRRETAAARALGG